MPKIKFIKEKKEVEVAEGANLRKAAMQNGVEVYRGVHKYLHCPGFGMCTTCRVYVKDGKDNVSKPGLWERITMLGAFFPLAFFARIGHEDEIRLSCQIKVKGDCEIETRPEFNWHGDNYWS